ncbi:Alpha/beta hydrolase family protein [Klenkia soli]|uniref:Alpha/beta hydrolase family protein n=1 Tax=Klenkia soli TaxID=1052260 RepID=A0A1H0R5S6_9ACTN|nr:alpha/beta fold hydrolase [Klenkia soli]SDP24837.1 Alpha/beta hydrolase family protein [Klenkia soli]
MTAHALEWQRTAAALVRAMPRHRMVGNGMQAADADELHAGVSAGTPWSEVAVRLARRQTRAAMAAIEAGDRQVARDRFLRAAACYSFGQVPLEDGPAKRSLYRDLVDAFGRAGALLDPPAEHVEVPWRGRSLRGWLLRPSGVVRPPVVVVLGGIDAWREEYAAGAELVRDRGVALLLLDAPGQGETRVLGGLHLDRDVRLALSAAVTQVLADDRLGDRVAVWGNSMGGHLAALLAAQDPRISACVVTGGTVRPAETHTRFPRFLGKVQAMLGLDPEASRTLMDDLELDAGTLAGLTCPLLVQHGARDAVFKVANAREVHDLAGSADKTWQEWSDGDHCVDNHADEKYLAVARWLAPRLTGAW